MRSSLIPTCMRRIAAGTMSREEAADNIGCSVRQVNRLMLKHGVERPVSPVHAARAAAAARRGLRAAAAKAVLDGRWRLQTAAKKAGMSERTLYRWMNRVKTIKKRQK